MRAPITIPEGDPKSKDYIEHPAEVPTSWSDISLGEFYEFTKWSLTEPKDFVRFYEIMTGVDYDILKRLRDGSVTETLDTYLGFLWKNPKDAQLHKYPIPHDFLLMYGDELKVCKVPQKLELKQLGQKWATTLHFQDLKKTVKDPVDFQKQRAAGIIAIFMYQEITGSDDFDLPMALAYIPRILTLPATTAVPLSVFFWNRFTELVSNGPGN